MKKPLISAACALVAAGAGCTPGVQSTPVAQAAPVASGAAPAGVAAWHWEWKWKAAAGEAAPKVEVSPLKYGKGWAYAVEIDDGPASTIKVSAPLLARYQWNDAPPGVAGGTNRPFSGGAAVILSSVDTGNSTGLTYAQLEELKKAGWSILNHSYWHTGNHWDPKNFLKPEDFRRELFWSQAVYAEMIGNGRGATHFVYPNGDYHYQDYLAEFGLQSASRVGASSPRKLMDAKANLRDWTRNYLDEGVWSQQSGALWGLPEKPAAGDFVIDFTHGMDGDENSANNKRWVARLDHLAKTYGPQGDNSMWVAPSDEVANYAVAAKAAKVTSGPGDVSVTLPDTLPGSALTLKITGLPAKAASPAGATVFRQGDTVWVTTPLLGAAGSALPAPRVHRIYSGPIKPLTWDKPVAIAGVRIRQFGGGAPGFVLKMDYTTPDGKTESLLPDGETKLEPRWGSWVLFSTVPDRPAPSAKELRVTPGKDLNEMEVWAVE